MAEPLQFENGKIHLTSNPGLSVDVDEAKSDNDVNHQLKLGINSVTPSGLDIDQVRAAMMLDTAIDVVNEVRSYLASEQNRLAFTMSNLTGQIQNIEASRSSIQDADFVSETMDLAKAQILSQSSSVMLAQANASIQKVLSLLR